MFPEATIWKGTVPGFTFLITSSLCNRVKKGKKKKSFISQKYVIKYTYKSMTLCIYSEPVNSSCAHNSSSLRNQKPKEKKKITNLK